MVEFFIFIIVLLFLMNKASSVRKPKSFKYIVIGTISFYWGFALINAPDIEGYMYCYNIMKTSGDPYIGLMGLPFYKFEFGFVYYMFLIKKCVDSYYFFQFVSFFLELGLTFYGINRLLKDETTTLKVMIAFALQFTLFMAAMRQGVAIALFIASLPFVVERKYLQTLTFILCGFFFHRSVIIVLFLILLYWAIVRDEEEISFKQWITIPLFLLCNFIYFSGYSLSENFSSLSLWLLSDIDIAENRDYTSYAESLSGTTNFGVLKVFELDFCYLVCFLKKRKSEFNNMNLLLFFFLVYFVVNLSAGGMLVHRIGYFLSIPYYIILFSSLEYLFHYMFNIPKRFSSQVTLGYVIFLFFIQKLSSGSYIFEYHLFDFL